MAMKKDLPTVAQLAQAAGVSPATVSRVLNHKGIVKADTYNRVVAVLQAKGYPFVEKAGRADPSDVLMISLPSLDNPFYADIVRGAKSGATRHGYHLIINESHINHNTLPGILELVHSLRISGLITVNHISTDILHTLSNVVPLVQCCEYDESTDLPYVSVDDFAPSKKATDILLSRGCRRIAFLSGPSRYKYARWRLRGYEEALRAAGIAPDQNLVVQFPEVSCELAIASTMHLLRPAEPPDAFVTTSDVYAAAVIRAARQVGLRVPQDVMVTGFDNIEFSTVTTPSITTVDQPRIRMGLMACELLVEKISNPALPSKGVLLETELIVRESTSDSRSAPVITEEFFRHPF